MPCSNISTRMDSIVRALEQHLQEVLLPISAAWGLRLGEGECRRFTSYAVELLRWNERINLTRITAPREIVIRHFLDSLACARAFDTVPAALIDIGTGAGFPGIPLKIVWPDMALTLSDSIGKKTAFLRHVVDLLDLRGVEVITARAEELGRDPAYREAYDGVVARAVAALDVLSEYCLPLCRTGGRFVAPKGAGGRAEALQAGRAIGRLGGRLGVIIPVELPDLEGRTLVVVDKVRPTPPDLPRPAGMAARRPL